MSHPFDLSGRVVLVFGAGSSGAGLSNGEAAALAYAAAGASVAAVDLDPAESTRVADAIEARGGSALALTADVTRDDQVAEVVATATATLGTPHVVHHNVGAPTVGSLLDLDPQEWDDALRLNLTSVYSTLRHVLPAMLEAGRGVVTTVSSVASIRDTGYVYPAYSSAKAAVNQLTTSVALTHAAQGIRANALLLGLIDTPLAGGRLAAGDDAREARHAASPTGRMGSPWDAAHAAVFLASDAAAYVNGVCLPVDGGLSARCL